MFAAVDLGSNSFRLHIGREDGKSIRVVKSARDPIRLGAGLDHNCSRCGARGRPSLDRVNAGTRY